MTKQSDLYDNIVPIRDDVKIGEPGAPLKGGGGGGTFDGMDGLQALEKRVGALEGKLDKMELGLQGIALQLAEIKGGLAGFATKDDIAAIRAQLGKVEGRIDALPTMAKMSILVGLAVLFLTAVGGILHFWGFVVQAPKIP